MSRYDNTKQHSTLTANPPSYAQDSSMPAYLLARSQVFPTRSNEHHLNATNHLQESPIHLHKENTTVNNQIMTYFANCFPVYESHFQLF
jgi:hypothetical protein